MDVRRLSACETTQQTRFGKEPTATAEADEGNNGVGPEQSLEESCSTLASTTSETELIKVVAGDGDGKEGVTENPEGDQTGTETLV